MKVRRGTYNDIAEIVQVKEDYHPNSNLHDIPFVRKDAVKIVQYYLAASECCPLVVEDDEGQISGLLFASVEPFFFNKAARYATDLMFISNGYGMALLNAFKEWAHEVGVDRIMMGVSSGDVRADTFLELAGFKKTGGMYVIH